MTKNVRAQTLHLRVLRLDYKTFYGSWVLELAQKLPNHLKEEKNTLLR